MQVNTRDVTCGLVFIVIAALFGYGLIDLPIGKAVRMGPGYFPLVLSIILGLLGVGILLGGLNKAPSPIGGIPWRGLFFILIGPIVFGLTVRGLGIGPAVALVATIAALASARATPVMIAGIAIGMTVFCVVVFHYGLGLPYALLGPWVTGLMGGV